MSIINQIVISEIEINKALLNMDSSYENNLEIEDDFLNYTFPYMYRIDDNLEEKIKNKENIYSNMLFPYKYQIDDYKENKEKTKKETRETDKSQIKNNKYQEIKKTKKEKIFKYLKVNRKRGRLNNESKIKKFKGRHNKFSDDNIIRKIKVRFLKYLMNFLNLLHSDCTGNKNSKFILLLDSSFTSNINRKDNLEWFDKTIKDFFSNKISSRFTKIKSNENINKIKEFYEKEKNSPIKLIQIMEMKIRDLYEIYIKEEKEEGFEELNNLYYDKRQLENEMRQKKEDKINEYLEKYEDFAKNLEQKFQNKGIRNYNKK